MLTIVGKTVSTLNVFISKIRRSMQGCLLHDQLLTLLQSYCSFVEWLGPEGKSRIS